MAAAARFAFLNANNSGEGEGEDLASISQ